MVSILRIMLADGTGVIDGFLKGIHLVNENINLMGSEKAFMPVYVLSGVWQTMGWNSIIFIAALSSVEPLADHASCRPSGNSSYHYDCADSEYGKYSQCRV